MAPPPHPSTSHAPTGTHARPLASDWLAAWARQGSSGHRPALEQAWLQALAERLGATHATLAWYDKGHAHITAQIAAPSAGHTGRLDATLIDALDEAADQGVCLRHPVMATHDNAGVTRALSLALHALMPSCGHAISLPLPGAQEPLGALLLCWPPGPGPTQELEAILSQEAAQAAPLLHLQRLAQRPWHWHVRQAAAEQWQHWRHPPDAMTRRWRTALLLALAALVLVPWPQKIGGQARIEGLQQRVLAAPTDGFIKAAHALPGDHVKAGAVLVDLAEQDLKLERDKWLSQISQFDNAYAAAMTRGDRSEAGISLSKLEEAQAQLALADEQLQRTQLKAPFDGVVIQGDLSQSIGAPVKQGDTLMTVATERGRRVIIDIDEGDIGLIQPGQSGSIALSALPWQTLDITVRRITPQSTARDGHNVYEVEASFNEALPAQARPGLMGPAKLQVGRSPLLWGWLRPVVDKARLWLWAWTA